MVTLNTMDPNELSFQSYTSDTISIDDSYSDRFYIGDPVDDKIYRGVLNPPDLSKDVKILGLELEVEKLKKEINQLKRDLEEERQKVSVGEEAEARKALEKLIK